jgi:hypothetical protein
MRTDQARNYEVTIRFPGGHTRTYSHFASSVWDVRKADKFHGFQIVAIKRDISRESSA